MEENEIGDGQRLILKIRAPSDLPAQAPSTQADMGHRDDTLSSDLRFEVGKYTKINIFN